MSGAHGLPLALKLVFTVFMAILIPSYWIAYGPTNFLYICDTALFFTLAAIWLESPLLAGAPAVGIVFPQLLWCVDFVVRFFGVSLLGVSDYMFDEGIRLFYRALSLFHGWLPFLLLYLVARLGYDRRAVLLWTGVTWVLLVACYLWTPPPPQPTYVIGATNPPANINWVFGPGSEKVQTWMPADLWLALMMAAMPLGLYLPTHWLFRRLWGAVADPGAAS